MHMYVCMYVSNRPVTEPHEWLNSHPGIHLRVQPLRIACPAQTVAHHRARIHTGGPGVYVCMYICMYMCVCKHTSIHAQTHETYVCIYVCVCVCVACQSQIAYFFTHTHTHKPQGCIFPKMTWRIFPFQPPHARLHTAIHAQQSIQGALTPFRRVLPPAMFMEMCVCVCMYVCMHACMYESTAIYVSHCLNRHTP